MKKIAIQFFGHLRTFRETYQNFIENVIKPNKKNGYKIDIFIHTWDLTCNTTASGGGAYMDLVKQVDEKLKKDIVKKYNPKKLLIEKQKNVKDGKILHLKRKKLGKPEYFISRKDLYNQYYTMYKVNELRKEYEKENNIKYDLILQTRPDILFKEKFDIDKILFCSNNLKEETFVFKDYDYKTNFPFVTCCSLNFPGVINITPCTVGATDVCFFSTRDVIDSVLNIFKDFDKHLENGFFTHEHFMNSYIYQKNIDIQLMPYIEGREFEILRVQNQNKTIRCKKLRKLISCFIPNKKLRRKIRGQI